MGVKALCIIGTMVIKKRKTPASQRLSKAFGQRVANLRLERQWSQQQLSDMAAGLDRGYISRIEYGLTEPCLATLHVLALAFDMTLSELLDGVG